MVNVTHSTPRYRTSGLLLGAALVLGAAGCSSSTDVARTPAGQLDTLAPTTPAPGTDSTASAPVETTGPLPAPPTATDPSSAVTPTGTSAGPAPCTTASLRVSLGSGGGGGAAGSVYSALVFVNTGSAPCTLNGHPGLSYVAGSDGHQVGASAKRGTGSPLTRVVLAPGKQAHATVRAVQAGVYPQAKCQPVPVRGYRVYPPDQKASVFLDFTGSAKACSSMSTPQLTVDTVQPGAPTQ